MPIAFNWVMYGNISPFNILQDNLPFLDFQNQAPSATYVKYVVGLKFQGSSVSNIGIWMDDDKADFFIQNPISLSDNPVPVNRQSLITKGFDIRVCLIDENNTSVYDQDPSTWTAIASPGTQNIITDGLSMGNAVMGTQLTAYSAKIGIALKVPANEPNEDIRNFRILATWDTASS